VKATPRGGGLAIVLVSLLAVLISLALGVLKASDALWLYLVGALLVAAVSWWDDLYSLPVRRRLLVHGLSALLLVGLAGFWRVLTLPWLGEVTLGWLGAPLTFLWVVGLTNIYNFMDGIDGLAGGQAVVAGAGWLVIGWFSGQPIVAALGCFLAAASLGFLLHNWRPARIFMGDVGSAFLGYSFAALTIFNPDGAGRFPLVGILVLWPFLFDAGYTMLRRWRNGENLFEAHRSHLYQRLVIAGQSHQSVTLLYLGLAVIGALLAIVWGTGIPESDLAAIIVPSLLAIALLVYVHRFEQRARCAAMPPALHRTSLSSTVSNVS
jgi:UDP-N-acetylmuramyl pentapeptide phosphotransferase/UDP-N-acetylglucosamine-1-phosphate transferase